MSLQLKQLRETYNLNRRAVDFAIGKKASTSNTIEINKEDIEERDLLRENITKAVEVIQAVTGARREQLKNRVEVLVTKGLKAVFQNQDLTFRFKINNKSSIIGIVPMLVSKYNGEEFETEITDGHGGGVADVVSFILRIVVLSLSNPKMSPVMILDESFRHVSPEYLRGVSTLLKELAETSGIQFLIITHKEELMDAADVIYRAAIDKNGQTSFNLQHNLNDEVYHSKPKRSYVETDNTSLFDGKDITSTKGEDIPTKRYGKDARARKRAKKRRLAREEIQNNHDFGS